jgi:hypothetical protein
MSLVFRKNSVGDYHVHDARSNDPVATISTKGKYPHAEWHPDFLKMNPSVGSTWKHRDFGNTSNVPTLKNKIEDAYGKILSVDKVEDPLETRFKHRTSSPDRYNPAKTIESDVYGIHHEGKEIGLLHHEKLGNESTTRIQLHPETKSDYNPRQYIFQSTYHQLHTLKQSLGGTNENN